MNSEVLIHVTPLPWRPVSILLLVRLADPLSFTILFPFVYFMVKDFNITLDDSEVGFYAGLIASSFAFSQMLSVIPWGSVSDKVGRRPVILIGMLGTAISLILFGLSQSLAWAIVTRSMCGLLSGNVGVVNTIMAELTDSTNRAQGFSLLPMMYGLGSIIGPTLGGFLSNPMDKYPELFGEGKLGGFLKQNPYFLPCFLSSLMILMGFGLSLVFLDETLTPRSPMLSEATLTPRSPMLSEATLNPRSPMLSEATLNPRSPMLSEATLNPRSPILSEATLNPRSPMSSEATLNPHSPMLSEETPLLKNDSRFELFNGVPQSSFNTILSFASQALVSVFQLELFPLWAATPLSFGGLGLSTSDIGAVLSFGGMSLLFIQLFLYPQIQKRLGTLSLYKLAYLFLIPISLLFPSITYLRSNFIFWEILLTLVAIRTACNVFIVTSVNILLVETCPDKSVLGKVNGVALACGSLVRAIGPILCGTIYSWSLSNTCTFPLLKAPLTWIILAAIAFMNFLIAKRIQIQ